MNVFHFEGDFHVRRQAASVDLSTAAILGERGQKDGSFRLQTQPRLRDSLNFTLPWIIVLLGAVHQVRPHVVNTELCGQEGGGEKFRKFCVWTDVRVRNKWNLMPSATS